MTEQKDCLIRCVSLHTQHSPKYNVVPYGDHDAVDEHIHRQVISVTVTLAVHRTDDALPGACEHDLPAIATFAQENTNTNSSR